MMMLKKRDLKYSYESLQCFFFEEFTLLYEKRLNWGIFWVWANCVQPTVCCCKEPRPCLLILLVPLLKEWSPLSYFSNIDHWVINIESRTGCERCWRFSVSPAPQRRKGEDLRDVRNRPSELGKGWEWVRKCTRTTDWGKGWPLIILAMSGHASETVSTKSRKGQMQCLGNNGNIW